MELIADGLLIAGALTAALYCWVLSRRLRALKAMDRGLGGAIAGLSVRVEQTKASLADTKATTGDLTRELSALTARAEIAAGRLELLLATLHEGDHASKAATRREEGARTQEAGAAQAPAPKEPPRGGGEPTPFPATRSGAEAATPSPRRQSGTGGDIVAALRRIVDGEARQ